MHVGCSDHTSFTVSRTTTTTTTTTRLRQVCVALCGMICCLSPVVDMSVLEVMSMADRDSAAKRRRERRLRMHWRHEQLTLRMVLATVEHHSYGATRRQLTATRTRAEERETYSAPRRQEPPLPAVTTGTQYFTLDDERVPVTGLRPTCLVEPWGPQERVSRHTMEQFGELAPMVQILDAPVPQLVDKLEDVLKILDLPVPVQEIDVPKISSLCRRRWNSWWTCHCRSGCGLRSAPMLLKGCESASGNSPRRSDGV